MQTCVGKENRIVTKLLKATNLKIAFKTTNTLQNQICNIRKPNNQKTPNKTKEYFK
jgi:hypothetical protein